MGRAALIWSVLAGGTAVFYALHGAWSVRISRRIGSVPAGWALFAFSLPFLAANLLYQGIPSIDAGFWGVWALNGGLNLAAWSLFFSAIRSGDLGLTYPLLALTPLMVLPVEWLLTGDAPAWTGAMGISLIVAGVYLLNYRRGQAGPLAPVAALMRDPGALKALGVAFIWSIAGTLDRIAVQRSSSAFYAFMLALGLSVLFLPLLYWTLRGVRRDPAEGDGGEGPDPRGFRGLLAPAGSKSLLLHGFLFACMVILQMEALTMALASYVLSIKRSGAILAVVIGYVAFGEEALGARLVGTLVTLAGASILVLWG